MSLNTEATCVFNRRSVRKLPMNLDSMMQLIVGLFLVFGRGLIVGRIKDPTRRDKINRLLKVTGPIVLGCALFVAIGDFVRKLSMK